MMRINIKKGLDIPVKGRPEQSIATARDVTTVASIGIDVHGIRPRMAVKVGDRVRLGQPLYVDKRNPDVPFTAPGAGEIVEINRGARRALQSVVIRLDGDDTETFASYGAEQLAGLSGDAVRQNLIASGRWNSLRTRPMNRIPQPDAQPAALFVTAIDTNPLCADPAVVINDAAAAFACGLIVMAALTDGPVYLCTAPDSGITCPDSEQFRHVEFAGPHPAGLAGTHIHMLEPVNKSKTVWHIGYQDVIAAGELFTSGRRSVGRVVALGGPMVREPRLLKTRVGANLTELLDGEILPGRVRIISGSVLSGHRAGGPLAWLGRYHNQVSVLGEGSEREFLSWARPGGNKYSMVRAFTGSLFRRDHALTTTQNGSPRAMVPIGTFEKLMPLDILPTPLLKALVVQDTDRAQELGCLELAEEDLALCSFSCNGKYDYGEYLRMGLDEIEAYG